MRHVGAKQVHTSWLIAGIIMPRALKRSSIMFKATSELIERFREHITMDSVIKMLQDTHGMPAIQHDRSQKNFGSSIGFHPAICKEMIRVVAVFDESTSCPVVTTGTACENEMPAHRAVIYKTCTQGKFLTVLLASLLNKLLHEHEFENPVNFCPSKCALKYHSLLRWRCIACHLSIWCIMIETSPVTCESKNSASSVRALEK